jgi:putative SOS response-associated peptidase YedK
MCGRFTLTLDPGELQEKLDLGPFLEMYQPRYNIAPTQPVSVVRDGASRAIEQFRWGLIPSWAKDMDIGNRMINARAETLIEKPSFRNLIKRKRCLILADGFFEWSVQDPAKGKVPFYFQVDDGEPFTFAGLYDEWKPPEGEKVFSCTIITCAPNELVNSYHNRMPVILGKEKRWKWIEEGLPIDPALNMLLPYPAEEMSVRQVSKAINSPQNDSPDILLAENR